LKTAAGVTVATFDAATSANLSISGSTLTINPTADLTHSTGYKLEFAAGTIKDLAGNSFAGTTSYNFTTASGTTPVPTVSYTVPGTLGNDFFIPNAGNKYQGGRGDDTYLFSPHTLSGSVTATVNDREGSNLIQFVDGLTIASGTLYANEAFLTLSNGASVLLLSADRFSYQLGANAPAGDTATTLNYTQLATTLGVTLPSGITPAALTSVFAVPTGFTQAGTPTPASASTNFTVPGTLANDVILPAGNNKYQGGRGDDTYIISPYTLSGPVTATLNDREGSNVIEFVDGMTIASSLFYSNEAVLTLANGASLLVLSADRFTYRLGANTSAGDSASNLSYTQFGTLLGASVPTSGILPVSGTANYVVPGSAAGNGFTQVNLSSGTVTATAAAEEFRYDFQIVGGRVAKAGDGEVTITGFDVAKDKLVFVNTSNTTTYTEAEFSALGGVDVSQSLSQNYTAIDLDSFAGNPGGVKLTGIVDAALAQIVLETV
jgi:hypothetical protein